MIAGTVTATAVMPIFFTNSRREIPAACLGSKASDRKRWSFSSCSSANQTTCTSTGECSLCSIARPISETVHDTLFWDRGRPQENTFRHALKPDKEAAVLSAWKAANA